MGRGRVMGQGRTPATPHTRPMPQRPPCGYPCAAPIPPNQTHESVVPLHGLDGEKAVAQRDAHRDGPLRAARGENGGSEGGIRVCVRHS